VPVPNIGPYELLERIGTGGMGTIYRARQRSLERMVALKLLSTELCINEEATNRFTREMRLAAAISHPNLVKIFDGGVVDDTPYIAMELLEGHSIETLIQKGGVPWQEAARICRDVAAGLSELHQQGILHRDIKPSNVMLLPDGTAKLIDFGIARAFDSTLLTTPGALLGTPVYMAPELTKGAPPHPGSDLWALGCMLYQLLTGKHPVPPTNPSTWLRQLHTHPISRPSKVCALPPALDHICMQLLARDPANRTASATFAARELAECQAEKPVATSKGRPWAVVLASALLAAIWWWRPVRPQPIPPRQSAPPAPWPGPKYFLYWREIDKELAQLRQGGEMARLSVVRLRSQSPCDLGKDPALWIQWANLGRWLESDHPTGPPPQNPRASRNSMDFLDEHMARELVRSAVRWSPNTHPPQLMAATLHMVEVWPMDGRPWLLLGKLLREENLLRPAATAFRVGLERPGSKSPRDWMKLLWVALAQALCTVRGHDLAREWPVILEKQWNRGTLDPWTSLMELEPVLSAGVIERLCMPLLDHPGFGSWAAWTLGNYRATQIGKESQYNLFTEYLQRAPQATILIRCLRDVELLRGEREAAIRYNARLNAGREEETFFQTCVNWPSLVKKQAAISIPFMDLMKQLINGDQTSAGVQLKQLLEKEDSPGLPMRAITLEYLGATGPDPRLERFAAERILPDGPWVGADSSIWLLAARTLATPKGQPIMRHLLENRSVKSSLQEPLVRGLWLATQGRYDEALDALDTYRARVPATPPSTEEQGAQLEILARPIWAEARGLRGSAAAAQRAKAYPHLPSGLYSDYWLALRSGRLDDALRHARTEQLSSCGLPVWQLTAVWAAAARRDPAALEQARQKFRIWGAYMYQVNWVEWECQLDTEPVATPSSAR
jgi:serine/threonine protein kinase